MYNKWSSHESQMNYHSYTTGLYGAVDTVHLIKVGNVNNFCLVKHSYGSQKVSQMSKFLCVICKRI